MRVTKITIPMCLTQGVTGKKPTDGGVPRCICAPSGFRRTCAEAYATISRLWCFMRCKGRKPACDRHRFLSHLLCSSPKRRRRPPFCTVCTASRAGRTDTQVFNALCFRVATESRVAPCPRPCATLSTAVCHVVRGRVQRCTRPWTTRQPRF